MYMIHNTCCLLFDLYVCMLKSIFLSFISIVYRIFLISDSVPNFAFYFFPPNRAARFSRTLQYKNHTHTHTRRHKSQPNNTAWRWNARPRRKRTSIWSKRLRPPFEHTTTTALPILIANTRVSCKTAWNWLLIYLWWESREKTTPRIVAHQCTSWWQTTIIEHNDTGLWKR